MQQLFFGCPGCLICFREAIQSFSEVSHEAFGHSLRIGVDMTSLGRFPPQVDELELHFYRLTAR
jgi:hypothetical protein